MSTRSNDFSGSYEGKIDGIKTTLRLQQQGVKISGQIAKGSSHYNVVGISTPDGIQARMTDAENVESYVLQAEINNSYLIVHLISHDLQSRAITQDSYTFSKVEGKSDNIYLEEHEHANISEFDNDINIVGKWSREEYIGSKEKAISTQVVIELDEHGDYELVGAIALQGTKDTGYSGDTTKGKWRTRSGTFYILVSGSKYWKPYAKYHLLGENNMIFTLEDGERQNWVKQCCLLVT